MTTTPNAPSARLRRLGLGLLLLAVPACGLSDYEARMLDAQEREKRFQEEEKYLDKPLEMPTKKVQSPQDKKERDVALANVFFRPPKGIQSKPKPEQRNGLMWTYPTTQRDSDFPYVEMAFAEDDKDFVERVVANYQAAGQPTQGTRQVLRPSPETPLDFDTWEFASAPISYSVNILKGRPKPIALVFFYKKAHLDLARKVIELSLQSLAFDQQAATARQRYNQKMPWQLQKMPAR